ncbi:MAG TPA: transglycosylase domain-containing protein [Myxococcales bacterium]|jgi:hypothetical protein
MRKWILRSAAIALFLTSLPLVGIEGLYRYGLHRVGSLPTRPVVTLDERYQRLVWAAMEDGPFEVEALYPWDEILGFARAFRSRPFQDAAPPGKRSAALAARSWAFRVELGRKGMGTWHLGTWALAVWLTRHWSAAELTQVVSEARYFGRGAVGLNGAGRRYFGKEGTDLAPREVALLFGISVSPARFSPTLHPTLALEQRNEVLRRFVERGLLSPEAAKAEMNAPLGTLPADDEEAP